ncbi:MAG: hypothetical protein IAF02_02630 [Anaerolineae bacterium]|nr:hypothetical protein [Anaerolineae bacterium]
MTKDRLKSVTAVTTLLLLLLLFLAPNWPELGDEEVQVDVITGSRAFDFVSWELNALLAKATAVLSSGTAYLSEETQKEIVLEYLETINQINRLNWEIEQIYADPAIANPDVASQEKQAELVNTRQKMQRLQVLAEAIVQDQVATLLAEEGLALGGQTSPPVMMHMTPLPLMMIVSPRDEIQNKYQRPLTPGLTAAEKDEMETAVYENANLSALVVPIGGLATYPAMIMETSSVTWLPDVTAHEWAHHWLMPYPISINYMSDPSLRTINETVASIVGREIGEQVVARYYPEFVPPPPPDPTVAAEIVPEPVEPPPFDFQAEMAETRRVVDAMLAEGDIEGAETYMEERRHIFVENNYNLRKLNQAYFAFYGAYADEPGATGDDPIGPTLLAMRQASPSLKEFMRAVATISNFEDFERVAGELGVPVAASHNP